MDKKKQNKQKESNKKLNNNKEYINSLIKETKKSNQNYIRLFDYIKNEIQEINENVDRNNQEVFKIKRSIEYSLNAFHAAEDEIRVFAQMYKDKKMNKPKINIFNKIIDKLILIYNKYIKK